MLFLAVGGQLATRRSSQHSNEVPSNFSPCGREDTHNLQVLDPAGLRGPRCRCGRVLTDQSAAHLCGDVLISSALLLRLTGDP